MAHLRHRLRDDDEQHNHGNVFWVLLPLLLLWWLPLIFAAFGNAWRNIRGSREVVAEDGGVVAAPVLGYSRTRDLARMARDAFITLLGGLFLVHLLMGCIDSCVYGAAWAAFAFFLINYLLTLIGGRFNVLSPLWILAFAISAIVLFACAYSNYDDTVYSGYKGVHD